MNFDYIGVWHTPALQGLVSKLIKLPENRDAAYSIREAQKPAIFGEDAIIHVKGVLGSEIGKYPWTTEYEEILGNIDEALEEGAKSINFMIDSPGGMFVGLPEVGVKIRNLEVVTRAIVPRHAMSAAYWIASQCKAIWAKPSAYTGSIGVITMPIEDYSKYFADLGITISDTIAGKFKSPGHFFGTPVSQEQIDQARADTVRVWDLFKSTVSSARPEIELDNMEGQVFFGQDAIDRGFVDKIFHTEQEIE